MSEYDGKNIFERIGAFVPGYKGYKEKEQRRDSDRLLRTSLAKQLTDKRSAIDQAVAQLMRSGRLDLLETLERIKRQLDNLATKIRTAPQGYSGFFDTVQVKNEDLDRLYRFDLGLREKATQTVGLVDGLAGAKDPAGACAAVERALQELDELARQRDHVIAEVK